MCGVALKKEFQEQLLACFEAGDVDAFADEIIANEAIVQPLLLSDNPDLTRNDAMIEALYTIFDLPDAKKTSEFMIRLILWCKGSYREQGSRHSKN